MKSTLKSHAEPATHGAGSEPRESRCRCDGRGPDCRCRRRGGLTKKADLRSWIAKRLLCIHAAGASALFGVGAYAIIAGGEPVSVAKAACLLAFALAQVSLMRPIIRFYFQTRPHGGGPGNNDPPQGIQTDATQPRHTDATQPRLRDVTPPEVGDEKDR